jgi:hypothetical protein
MVEMDHRVLFRWGWSEQYPGYNYFNLETQGVLSVRGTDFAFVHQSHPFVNLLHFNKDIIGTDILDNPKIEDYFRISKNTMEHCVKTLKMDLMIPVMLRSLQTMCMLGIRRRRRERFLAFRETTRGQRLCNDVMRRVCEWLYFRAPPIIKDSVLSRVSHTCGSVGDR